MHIYMNAKYSWKGPVEPAELCDSDGNVKLRQHFIIADMAGLNL